MRLKNEYERIKNEIDKANNNSNEDSNSNKNIIFQMKYDSKNSCFTCIGNRDLFRNISLLKQYEARNKSEEPYTNSDFSNPNSNNNLIGIGIKSPSCGDPVAEINVQGQDRRPGKGGQDRVGIEFDGGISVQKGSLKYIRKSHFSLHADHIAGHI